MGWYRKRILKSSTIKAVNKQSSIIIYSLVREEFIGPRNRRYLGETVNQAE